MAPILSLQINTLTGAQYDLNQQGIMDIFSRFGKVANIIMKPEGKAFIVFNEMSHALFAQKSLNSQYLPDIQANIRVEWVSQVEYDDLEEIDSQEMPRIIEKKSLEKSIEKDETNEGTNSFKFQTSIPVKFTCRYEIQIENDKDFQVARKIIGSKVLKK
jgi:RNA recognition motif-containing protein